MSEFIGSGLPEEGMGLPPQQKMNINIKDLTDVVCERCNHNLFQSFVALKRVSPIVSGLPKTQYIPIQVFACADCGELPEDFKKMISGVE